MPLRPRRVPTIPTQNPVGSGTTAALNIIPIHPCVFSATVPVICNPSSLHQEKDGNAEEGSEGPVELPEHQAAKATEAVPVRGGGVLETCRSPQGGAAAHTKVAGAPRDKKLSATRTVKAQVRRSVCVLDAAPSKPSADFNLGARSYFGRLSPIALTPARYVGSSVNSIAGRVRWRQAAYPCRFPPGVYFVHAWVSP